MAPDEPHAASMTEGGGSLGWFALAALLMAGSRRVGEN